MRRPVAVRSRLAWSAVALYIVLVVTGLRMHATMMGIGATDVWVYFAVLWGALIGALILGRYPTHPVGWLFISVALSFGIVVFSSGYALEAIVFDPDTLPGGELAAWISFWAELPGVAALALFLPLLFPDGHLPSARWRPVAWLCAVLLGTAVVVTMVTPDAYPEYPNVRNPLGIDAWAGAFALINGLSEALLIALVVLCGVALFDRRRRATQVERLQLRWFAFAVVILVLAFIAEELTRFAPGLRPLSELLAILAVTALPTAAGIAILRYRLYDIDVIINRTVVYVSLTAVLAGLYTAAVALFQRMIVALTGESSDLAVVMTLFVLATVFTPLKNTLQSSADRYIKPIAPPATGQGSAIDDLVKLAELHARGILTDEEFAAKKKQVLGI
jgi:putative oligomerization/nucleic acid binding protein